MRNNHICCLQHNVGIRFPILNVLHNLIQYIFAEIPVINALLFWHCPFPAIFQVMCVAIEKERDREATNKIPSQNQLNHVVDRRHNANEL